MAKKRKAPFSQQSDEQEKVEIEDEENETYDDGEEEGSEVESSSSDEVSEYEEDDNEDDESASEEEEGDEASKREALRGLLEPFGKDQIIDILKEAAEKDAVLVKKIVQIADADPVHRKIFVHGLGWDATPELLAQVFKQFGEIEDSKLLTDKNTGRAKGYAFVLFKTRSAARKALKVPQKQIGSRNVSCQLASIGPISATQVSETGKWKVYVGNVGPNVNPEKLKAFFRKYGEIEDVPIGLDSTTNKFKGFAVITYKSSEGYSKSLEEPDKVFENTRFYCKKFVENNRADKNNEALHWSTNTATNDSSYSGLGVNAGALGSQLNAAGYLMGQNTGMGLAGNGILNTGYNPAGFMTSGLTPFVGIGGGSNYGASSVSPSVMGRYGSQASLQGVGPFQSDQIGHSSARTTTTEATTAARDPGRLGKEAPFTSYFRK